MVGVLIHVCCDQATLATGLENPEAFLENRTDFFKKAAVACNLAEILTRCAVVSLIPVRRAGDNERDGLVLDKG